jgi:hypothetical protein
VIRKKKKGRHRLVELWFCDWCKYNSSFAYNSAPLPLSTQSVCSNYSSQSEIPGGEPKLWKVVIQRLKSSHWNGSWELSSLEGQGSQHPRFESCKVAVYKVCRSQSLRFRSCNSSWCWLLQTAVIPKLLLRGFHNCLWNSEQYASKMSTYSWKSLASVTWRHNSHFSGFGL